MGILTKILKIVFFISLPVAIFLSFYRPKLPDIQEIRKEIKTIPPVQEKFESEDVSKIIEGFEYRISPKYRYEIYGLVVSDYDSDNWLDVRHENDPGNIKDICVVWGENILNGSYKDVSYKSGEFTCYYSWESDMNTFFPATYCPIIT